ncbi:MAG: glycosyltransferase [Desulfobacteraceae bacterium]|nr:MAG: glycosyltransferase [Desulfobacteraceae bacterium]
MLPKLYGCMMLKDEARNIRRCLDSIRKLCDEIVIVDTGSIDDTVKIARGYGAIVYPGTFNWRKPPIFDFSLHRNAGLQYCEELGADWLLVIDGDESLKPIGISPQEFKARLLRLPKNIHALGTQVHEQLENGAFALSLWGTRFFKARVGVHYEGIVHNRPKLYRGGYCAASNVIVYHHGYHDNKVMAGKRARTIPLLDKRIKENPEDYEAYYYKCLSLCGQDKVEEAIVAGEKCMEILGEKIDQDPARLNYFGIMYYAIGWAYFRLWELTDTQHASTRAYQWWYRGWELFPDDIDLNFQLCTMGYMSRNPDMTREHGERYQKSMERLKQEIEMDAPAFENEINLHTWVLGPRHIHLATPKHEAMVRSMMEEMGRIAA